VAFSCAVCFCGWARPEEKAAAGLASGKQAAALQKTLLDR
jgi:hypothetical protein